MAIKREKCQGQDNARRAAEILRDGKTGRLDNKLYEKLPFSSYISINFLRILANFQSENQLGG